MISGLISTIGSGTFSGARSMTTSRSRRPTCGAARPMPGAAYMVANIAGISARTSSMSAGVTARATLRNTGSGTMWMGNNGVSVSATDMPRL